MSTGRPKDVVHKHFWEPYEVEGKKTKRTKCEYCKESILFSSWQFNLQIEICATAQKEKDHLSSCKEYEKKQRKRPPSDEPESNPATTAKKTKQSTLELPTMTVETKLELDLLLARAIHRKGQPFDVVSGVEWDAFFEKLNPLYKRPPDHRIGSELLSIYILYRES